MQRPNPTDLSVTGSIRLGENEDAESRALTSLIQEALQADNDRHAWFERQKALTKLRYCIRPRQKDWPWPNASNLGIPFIDSTIRKHKPQIIRLFTEPDPVVEFQGESPQAVEKEREAEEVYNWLFKIKCDAIEPLCYAADIMDHRGTVLVQVGWDYRTELECRTVPVNQIFPEGVPQDPEQIAQALVDQYDINASDPKTLKRLQAAVAQIQAGAPFVKLAHQVVVKDQPGVWERDPVQIIAPSRMTDVGNAEWIIVQHILSVRQLQRMEADGFFEPGSVKKIVGSQDRAKAAKDGRLNDGLGYATGTLEQERALEDDRERIWGEEDPTNVLIWQVFHWYDYDKDGLDDRCETWLHPRSKTKLASRPYLMPFHSWPFVKFDFEKTNRRWFSPRGISHMLEGLNREINFQHNTRIDGMTLRNAPAHQIQVLSGYRAANFRVRPGAILQLPAGSKLEPILHDSRPFGEQMTEETQLRAIGEQYIGTLDATLGTATNPGKARTATEIQAQVQYAGATASLDATLWQLAMRKLHTMIWKLWLDLGPDEVYIKVITPDDAQPVGRLVKKADIAHEYTLVPTGTITNTNRALELAHAREALQIYVNDQTGLINPFELRRWHLNLLTYRWARRILNDPQQAQELQTLRQAAAEVQNNPGVQAALTGGVQHVQPEEAARQQLQYLPRNTQQLGM